MKIIYIILAGFMLLPGCVPGPVNFQEERPQPFIAPEPVIQENNLTDLAAREDENALRPVFSDRRGLFRNRGEIPSGRNRYEGSLWKGDASFGNFMRDQRAMYRDELVKVTNLQAAISKFNESADEQLDTSADQALKIAEEQRLQVLAGLSDLTVRVVDVNQDGILKLYGQKVEFKDRNNVRFVTTLRGFARPNDVMENNTIDALSINSFEIKTNRSVKISPEQRERILTERKNRIAGSYGENYRYYGRPTYPPDVYRKTPEEIRKEEDLKKLQTNNAVQPVGDEVAQEFDTVNN